MIPLRDQIASQAPVPTDALIDRLRPLLPPLRRPLTKTEIANVERWRLRLGWREPVNETEVSELDQWRTRVGDDRTPNPDRDVTG